MLRVESRAADDLEAWWVSVVIGNLNSFVIVLVWFYIFIFYYLMKNTLFIVQLVHYGIYPKLGCGSSMGPPPLEDHAAL
ncbi:hypothetical protein QVD17_09982 [Tagetes erecta]|uniref:Uncharacterized protein n=1 Tax=Tagetes erecta TaxID=13708 RepID=A0AAD8L5D8_TARER|nr:hypothetical protein QVD17_09982 [Tagetes erecta]